MDHSPDIFTIDFERDASPEDAWVIDFCVHNKNIWHSINNYQKHPISFDAALHGLQALVKKNCIGVALGQSDIPTVFYYRFPPNSAHYRIRNIRTDEKIYGDILT
jgi:hypothetical protein